MIEVGFPRSLDFKSAIKFCNEMWRLEESEEYNFDFKELRFTEPFTLAYVSIEMKRFRKYREGKKFRASNYQHLSYQSHMGFFRAFGLKFGNEPGEASGSGTYLPITILKKSDLVNEAYDDGIEIGDLLEIKSGEIAQILTQNSNENLTNTLTFSVREIMRNVVEHSNSEIIEYCAQYWPKKNMVEVAIFDTGDGILKGLSENPFLSLKSERDAIQLALMPGISGKMYKGVFQDKNNPWQNSGYGLYMTNRICRQGSSFLILSNDSGLIFNSKKKEDISCSYKGVALRLRINTMNLENCSTMLESFREEGRKTSEEMNNGDIIEPSIASTKLASNFL